MKPEKAFHRRPFCLPGRLLLQWAVYLLTPSLSTVPGPLWPIAQGEMGKKRIFQERVWVDPPLRFPPRLACLCPHPHGPRCLLASPPCLGEGQLLVPGNKSLPKWLHGAGKETSSASTTLKRISRETFTQESRRRGTGARLLEIALLSLEGSQAGAPARLLRSKPRLPSAGLGNPSQRAEGDFSSAFWQGWRGGREEISHRMAPSRPDGFL